MVFTATILSRSDLGSSLAIRVGRSEGFWSCQPGQFYLLRTGAAWSPYGRRALFPTLIDPNELGFLLAPSNDPGLAWLAAQPAGTALDLIGPQGRGFTLHEHQRRILLMAEASAVAPLFALIPPALARQASITLLLHARRRADLLPAAALPPAVEYYTACDDPLPGQPTTLDDAFVSALNWADGLYLAGSAEFLRQAKAVVTEARFAVTSGFAQAVAPVALPCGVGACMACLVDSGRGRHRACVRGPVFDLGELAL